MAVENSQKRYHLTNMTYYVHLSGIYGYGTGFMPKLMPLSCREIKEKADEIYFKTKGRNSIFRNPNIDRYYYSNMEENIGKISKLLDRYNIEYLREYKLPGTDYMFNFYIPKYNILINSDEKKCCNCVYVSDASDFVISVQEIIDTKNAKNDMLFATIHYKISEELDNFITRKVFNEYEYKFWVVAGENIRVYKEIEDLLEAFNLKDIKKDIVKNEGINKKVKRLKISKHKLLLNNIVDKLKK